MFKLNRIDAQFFKRDISEGKGKIIFNINNLEETAELIISLMDKVKVIAPVQLK